MIRPGKGCVGCGACESVCPTNAIDMVCDKYGFFYPQVNREKCINCGRCDSVCLLGKKNSLIRDDDMSFFAACLNNPEELLNVSSGGVFWALAKQMIIRGGVVYGVCYIAPETVCHRRAEKIEEVIGMRKSKYLNSSLNGVFNDLKKDVKDGKDVLFSGLPCQIAAVYCYLGYRPDNLITCEVVCHGSPSLTAFRSFLDETEADRNSTVTSIDFRDKSAKWGHDSYAITFSDGKIERQSIHVNPYHKAYLEGLISRECCASCKYAGFPRVADITLGDFWMYRGELLKKSEENGVSLVVCTGKRGKNLLEDSREILFIEEVDKEQAVRSCYHLTHPPKLNVFRNRFLNDVATCGLKTAHMRYTGLHGFVARNVQRVRMVLLQKRKK